MLLRALLAAPLPLLAMGANVRRQDTASTSATTVAPDPNASSVSSATATATVTTPPTVPFTLVSSNPTAYPLTDIVQSPATHPTIALEWTFTAGQENSAVEQSASVTVPPLPTVSTVSIAAYPSLDVIPPTDSPEVLQWIQEVQNSGVSIPNIPQNVKADDPCAGNPAARANATAAGNCWWTCGQCTRDTDISTCPDKYTWGVSFDDGPSPDTPRLLDYLNQVNLHSTFFIVGSRALSRQDILQAEYMLGHQLSVHTWSHPSLTTLTNEQIIAELGWTAKIIKDVTGVTPNTFRPPYGDMDDRVRAIAKAMGFTPIIWTSTGSDNNFDTNDWHIGDGSRSASQVIAAFEDILTQAATLDTGFIVLAHDLYQQSVDLATGYILPDALARTNPSYKLMSIIECLKLPLSDAYKETNNNSTNPPPGGSGSGSGTHTGSGGATPTTTAHGGALPSTGAVGQMMMGLAVLVISLLML